MDVKFTTPNQDELIHLDEIRQRAFKPIFDSFRRILGDRIYEVAQLPEDNAQKELLASYFDSDNTWDIWKAEYENTIIGFIAFKIGNDSKIGEIGLNAIDPEFSGKGIGTLMYKLVIDEMKARGVKVVTVATGGDPAHEAARKAYRNAGFNVEIPGLWMCQELD